MHRRLPRPVLFAAGLAPILAAPMVTFALIGDHSETDPAHADYVIHPPAISAVTINTLALTATVLGLFGLALLIPRWRERTLHPGWRPVVVLLMIVGMLVSAIYRVATFATTGANIGFGALLVFGGPCAIALAAGAAVATTKILRTPKPPQSGPSPQPEPSA
jgi:hypothetical protein